MPVAFRAIIRWTAEYIDGVAEMCPKAKELLASIVDECRDERYVSDGEVHRMLAHIDENIRSVRDGDKPLKILGSSSGTMHVIRDGEIWDTDLAVQAITDVIRRHPDYDIQEERYRRASDIALDYIRSKYITGEDHGNEQSEPPAV
jgi:hypothetical protein